LDLALNEEPFNVGINSNATKRESEPESVPRFRPYVAVINVLYRKVAARIPVLFTCRYIVVIISPETTV